MWKTMDSGSAVAASHKCGLDQTWTRECRAKSTGSQCRCTTAGWVLIAGCNVEFSFGGACQAGRSRQPGEATHAGSAEWQCLQHQRAAWGANRAACRPGGAMSQGSTDCSLASASAEEASCLAGAASPASAPHPASPSSSSPRMAASASASVLLPVSTFRTGPLNHLCACRQGGAEVFRHGRGQ